MSWPISNGGCVPLRRSISLAVSLGSSGISVILTSSLVLLTSSSAVLQVPNLISRYLTRYLCFGRFLHENAVFPFFYFFIFTFFAVVDLLDYRPSTIAASAVLRAAGESPDISGRYDENAAILCELLSKVLRSFFLFLLGTSFSLHSHSACQLLFSYFMGKQSRHF